MSDATEKQISFLFSLAGKTDPDGPRYRFLADLNQHPAGVRVRRNGLSSGEASQMIERLKRFEVEQERAAEMRDDMERLDNKARTLVEIVEREAGGLTLEMLREVAEAVEAARRKAARRDHARKVPMAAIARASGVTTGRVKAWLKDGDE